MEHFRNFCNQKCGGCICLDREDDEACQDVFYPLQIKELEKKLAKVEDLHNSIVDKMLSQASELNKQLDVTRAKIVVMKNCINCSLRADCGIEKIGVECPCENWQEIEVLND